MNKLLSSLIVVLGMVFASQASAHVGYRSLDVNNPFTDSVTSDFGWYEGTQSTLANSHDLRWFSFTLATASYVDITVNSLGAGSFQPSNRNITNGALGTAFNSAGLLDLGVSLYKGLVPASSVESVTQTGVDGNGNPIYNGFPIAGQGITTTKANTTASSAYLGLGAGWNTLRNTAGAVGSIEYLTHVNGFGVGVTETISDYLLAAGSYTILVGGASETQFDELGNLINDGGALYAVRANLSVQPVPVPGAVWLFGSAVAGLIGFGRRKQIAA